MVLESLMVEGVPKYRISFDEEEFVFDTPEEVNAMMHKIEELKEEMR